MLSLPSFCVFIALAALCFPASLLAYITTDSLIVSDIPAPRGYWQNGVVPYLIDPSFTADERTIIQQQLAKIERNVPCNSLKIRLWSPDDKDYVYIQKSAIPLVCASDGLGRHGGEQGLHLGSFCFSPSRQGEILAQFMRILGFPSEHQRPDREQYIQVFYDAISIAHRRDYYKYSDWLPGWKSTDPYDFDSIAHASDDMFAFSPQLRTFRPLEPQERSIGLRQRLSRLDKIRLQRLFPCLQQQQLPMQQSIQALAPPPMLTQPTQIQLQHNQSQLTQFQQYFQSSSPPVQQAPQQSTVQPQTAQPLVQHLQVSQTSPPPIQSPRTQSPQQLLQLLNQIVQTSTPPSQPLVQTTPQLQSIQTSTPPAAQPTPQSTVQPQKQSQPTQSPHQQPQQPEQTTKLPTLAELLLAFDKVQEVAAANRQIFASKV